MKDVLYDDGVYVVTPSVISTPTRYYPLVNATVRVRQDPLYLGIAVGALFGSCVAVYGDLLRPEEVGVGIAITLLLLVVGANVRFLTIDAIGHKRAMLVGSRKKIASLFKAIRGARLAEFRGPVILDSENEGHPYD